MDEKTTKEIGQLIAGQIGSSFIVSTSLTTALLRVLIEKNIVDRVELEEILKSEKDNIVSEDAKVMYDHAMTIIFGESNKTN